MVTLFFLLSMVYGVAIDLQKDLDCKKVLKLLLTNILLTIKKLMLIHMIITINDTSGK